MQRRTLLLGLGSASVGGSALLGSGAFSRVESHRSVTIEVARDPDAYLGLDKCSTPNGSYTEIDDHGHLQVLMNPENANHPDNDLGAGINSNSRSWFDRVFQICNQGKETACVWIDPFETPGNDVDDPTVDFYLEDDDGRSIVGPAGAISLDVGACVCVGITTASHGLSADDELIPDNTVQLVADVDADCSVDAGPCEPCTIDHPTGDHLDVLSADVSSFPTVQLSATVDTVAGEDGTLGTADFAVCEDDCRQTPTVAFAGEGTSADIVFVWDESGSMSGEVATLQSQAEAFADDIVAQGVDAQFGIVGFNDHVTTHLPLTDDVDAFQSEVDDLVATGGADAPEAAFDAIMESLTLAFRPGAQKVIIAVTDAPSHYDGAYSSIYWDSPYTRSDVANALLAAGATFVAVSPFETNTFISGFDDDEGSLRLLAEDVDGLWIDINGPDFSAIIDEIEDLILSSYTITYTTTNPTMDGTVRTVLVAVDDPDEGTATNDRQYTAP